MAEPATRFERERGPNTVKIVAEIDRVLQHAVHAAKLILIILFDAAITDAGSGGQRPSAKAYSFGAFQVQGVQLQAARGRHHFAGHGRGNVDRSGGWSLERPKAVSRRRAGDAGRSVVLLPVTNSRPKRVGLDIFEPHAPPGDQSVLKLGRSDRGKRHVVAGCCREGDIVAEMWLQEREGKAGHKARWTGIAGSEIQRTGPTVDTA